MRSSRRRGRVWAELDALPDDPTVVYKALWDWLVTDGPRTIARAELVQRFEKQRRWYRAHGLPGRGWTRAVGRAPFAAWTDS